MHASHRVRRLVYHSVRPCQYLSYLKTTDNRQSKIKQALPSHYTHAYLPTGCSVRDNKPNYHTYTSPALYESLFDKPPKVEPTSHSDQHIWNPQMVLCLVRDEHNGGCDTGMQEYGGPYPPYLREASVKQTVSGRIERSKLATYNCPPPKRPRREPVSWNWRNKRLPSPSSIRQ